MNIKLPHCGGAEADADNRLALTLATNRLSVQHAARRSSVWRAHLVCVGDDEREYCKTSRVLINYLNPT